MYQYNPDYTCSDERFDCIRGLKGVFFRDCYMGNVIGPSPCWSNKSISHIDKILICSSRDGLGKAP